MEPKSTDLLDWIGGDAAAMALSLLDDPADLVRASCVSKSWFRFVMVNGFCKKLCMKMCPEVSIFTHVTEVTNSNEVADVGSSSSNEWAIMDKEHRAYSYLSHYIKVALPREECISESIGASSTDNYPDESIDYTLEPTDRVDTRPSYWSSKGESDPRVPEKLTYRLNSNLCIVNKVKIKPFKAFFQYGHPIHSSLAVRFKMGYHRLVKEAESDEDSPGQGVNDDNYVWTYVSPVYPMAQVSQERRTHCSLLNSHVLFSVLAELCRLNCWGGFRDKTSNGLYYIWYLDS